MAKPMVRVPMADVVDQAQRLGRRWTDRHLTGVWGIPRGGCVPAVLVAAELALPVVDEPDADTLVVDDLVDTGGTARRYGGHHFDALWRKPWAPRVLAPEAALLPTDAWLVFPWEVGTTDATGPADAVVRLLSYVGEDPTRPGLVDTPERVLRSWAELTAGYADDPAAILARRFPDDYDEMVLVRGVDFTSLCEHHVLAFTGTATVGYLPAPGQGVVGLSKLARLVDCFARRLQVQERLTMQIADAIEEHLAPLGVGVVVAATHSCMACRGVRKPRAEMVTSAMRGALRDRPEARAEFLALAGVGARQGQG